MSNAPITERHSISIIGFYSCATVPAPVCQRIEENRNELLELLRQAYERFTDNDMMPPNKKLQNWLNRTQAAIDKAIE